MVGLAEQSAMRNQQPSMQPSGQAPRGSVQPSVEDVVNLLMQGADPEVLLQQGVPMELLQQAVEIIMAQEQQMQTTSQPSQTETGLAMTAGKM